MAARDPSTLRHFFLAEPCDGDRARLREEDVQHALRVLRVATGDELVGLDGQGGSWRLAVRDAGKRKLELEVLEELMVEPAPGTVGAPLPRIELWLPLPKGGRAEEMVDRLTQLGAARIVALVTERTAPHAREVGPQRLERLARRAREACKQSGRRWMPEFAGALELEDCLEGLQAGTRLACLDPRGKATFGHFLAKNESVSAHSWPKPIALALGPEGGWSPAEEQRLERAGASRVRLLPQVLRIETAAEAACAIAAHVALTASRGD